MRVGIREDRFIGGGSALANTHPPRAHRLKGIVRRHDPADSAKDTCLSVATSFPVFTKPSVVFSNTLTVHESHPVRRIVQQTTTPCLHLECQANVEGVTPELLVKGPG